MMVTVAICSHNGADRIAQTLGHLACQDAEVEWEVLLVDNASSDQTADRAMDFWRRNGTAPMRVVREELLGLSHARQRALREARGGVISLVDDDNWVCQGWVNSVAAVMSGHPDVGACGGSSSPVLDTKPPSWFGQVEALYAIGPQGSTAGYVHDERGWLWGAGLSIRRNAWQEITIRGFRPLLADRTGAATSSGGDLELCYALRLSGWQLWYDPAIRFGHYVPGHRLTREYVRGLCRGVGEASVVLDAYIAALRPGGGLEDRLRRSWFWQIGAGLKALAWAIVASGAGHEPSFFRELIRARLVGRLATLWSVRSEYSSLLAAVHTAAWRARLVRPDSTSWSTVPTPHDLDR